MDGTVKPNRTHSKANARRQIPHSISHMYELKYADHKEVEWDNGHRR